MNKSTLVIIMVAATFIWYGFQGQTVKATTANQNSSNLPPTNLTGAELTGANLAGVSFDGVVICNTKRPDRTINNSGCKN
jgi:uncharacterized protein YjbI with pentapeptide repeats